MPRPRRVDPLDALEALEPRDAPRADEAASRRTLVARRVRQVLQRRKAAAAEPAPVEHRQRLSFTVYKSEKDYDNAAVSKLVFNKDPAKSINLDVQTMRHDEFLKLLRTTLYRYVHHRKRALHQYLHESEHAIAGSLRVKWDETEQIVAALPEGHTPSPYGISGEPAPAHKRVIRKVHIFTSSVFVDSANQPFPFLWAHPPLQVVAFSVSDLMRATDRSDFEVVLEP